jgi:hypothetical protein
MRDPESELYDRACDLVEAAAAIRQAMRPEAAAAVPALLGCLHAGLADLRLMSSALMGALDVGAGTGRDRLQQGLANLADALSDAEAAADAARMLVVRSTEAGAGDDGRRRPRPAGGVRRAGSCG